MEKTPALWNLVGIYFNQDRPEDYGTEEASVDAVMADFAGDRGELLNDLEWLLEHLAEERELEAYLDSQGNEYLPPVDQGGYRGWLMRIAERVGSTAR